MDRLAAEIEKRPIQLLEHEMLHYQLQLKYQMLRHFAPFLHHHYRQQSHQNHHRRRRRHRHFQ